MEFVNDPYGQNYSYSIDEGATTTMTVYVECTIPLAQGTILVMLNIALAIIGTFGNILIILAVLNTPRLRQKPSNFLLLSLAVADLLVTVIAQPLFAASMGFKAFSRKCVREVDLIYVLAAPLAASSSVFHLAAISIDRALSALTPHKHRDIITKGLKPMLVSCWILAAAVVCVLVLYPKATNAVYITLLLCLVVMIVSYGLILYKILASPAARMASSKVRRDRAMEKRVSGTVAIIIVLFAVCWIPLIAFHLSHSTTNVTETTYWWIRTLYLANSSMNFIVYSLRIKQFRVAYLKIINRSIRKFCLMLPEKCRCCVPTFDLRADISSSQNTPMSPSSTAVTMALTIAPREDQKDLNLEELVKKSENTKPADE